jgi:hypothetical protein
VSHVIWLRRLL